MRFSTYTPSRHIDTERQNGRLIQIVILIFTTSMFCFGHLQIATAQIVHIPDPGLRAVLESALGKEVGDDITQADMANLKSLQANNCHFLTLTKMGVWWKAKRWQCFSTDEVLEDTVQDLTGLEFAINLTEIHLGRNKISDVSPLKDLTNLTHLSLYHNQISDVSPLKDLTNLTHLFLGRNKISDVSSLKDLTKLVELGFEGNLISDVKFLTHLRLLTHLSLRENEILDISPIQDLTTLTYLSLRENQISDVSPLKDLTNLTYLHIGFNYKITDVSPLKNLTNLTHLQLDHNRISDVSPLKNLTDLRHFDASDNEISDLSSLEGFTKLTWIDLDTNKNLDLSHLKNFPNLTFLDLHDNEISDLFHLKDLTKLRRLDLDDNAISDISPLEGLTNLINLDLSGNQISDVSPLSGLVNLTVLDLRKNQISDFSPIAGLIENLVEYDNSNQTFPTYKPEDVNRDGVVNILDLVLVASNYGDPDLTLLAQMNIYPDVNSDGVLDIRDLVAIAAEIDSAAAPTFSGNSIETSTLTAENLKRWIDLANQLDARDPKPLRGIAVLEKLLKFLTYTEGLPKETGLLANYPNPFNPETWIPYQLAVPAVVNISIHSADGKLVRVLELGHLFAGIYHNKSRAAYWDGRNALGEVVASGVYFYTLTADDFTTTRKMFIRK